MKRLAFAVVFLAASVGLAADPITGPPTIRQGTIGVYTVDGQLLVTPPAGLDVKVGKNDDGTKTVWYVTGDPAKYTLTGWQVLIDFEKKTSSFKPVSFPIEVTPSVPVPPGPGPVPDPDNPDDPNPFGLTGGDTGVHVLIVYETETEHQLPQSQYLILFGGDFRDYLDKTCGTGGYRIFDQNVKPLGPAEWWVKAMSSPRKSVPWLYAGKGRYGYSGPLPKTSDEARKVIDKVAARKQAAITTTELADELRAGVNKTFRDWQAGHPQYTIPVGPTFRGGTVIYK